MAADGYGKGTVEGTDGTRAIRVTTDDAAVSFSLAKDATPSEIYAETEPQLREVNDERHLEHPE